MSEQRLSISVLESALAAYGAEKKAEMLEQKAKLDVYIQETALRVSTWPMTDQEAFEAAAKRATGRVELATTDESGLRIALDSGATKLEAAIFNYYRLKNWKIERKRAETLLAQLKAKLRNKK